MVTVRLAEWYLEPKPRQFEVFQACICIRCNGTKRPPDR